MFALARIDSNDAVASVRSVVNVSASIGIGGASSAESYEASAREHRARSDALGNMSAVLGAGAFGAGLMKAPGMSKMLAGAAIAAAALAKAELEKAKEAEAKAREQREAERQEAERQEAAKKENQRQESERQAAQNARDREFEAHLRDRMSHDRGDTYGGRASAVDPDRHERNSRTC